MENLLEALASYGAPSVQFNLDVIWTLVAGFMVFFMQAGFAMVEAGFVRSKNAGNVLMKNILDFSMGALAYWFIGFGLMFGSGSGFMGTDGFMPTPETDTAVLAEGIYEAEGLATAGFELDGDALVYAGPAEGAEMAADVESTFADAVAASRDGELWLIVFFIFQLVFAATAATIVSGAMAGRTKFTAYLIYSFVVSLVIYPISGHWMWGGLNGNPGWLENLGYLDFAGSGVVHMVGGMLALMGAIFLGPRLGKYGKDGKAKPIPGHNLVIAALGVFILWFGWYGFNPGSTTAGIADTGWIAATTTLAAAAGTVAALITSWIVLKAPDIGMTLNGALAGLVAITAPCDAVTPGASIIIGLVAGVLVVVSVLFVDRKLKIDDPVGAFSVHGVNGLWGILAVGLFNTSSGVFYGGGWSQFGVQALGGAAIIGWTVVTGGVLFGILKAVKLLRVSKEEELLGLDLGEHKADCYPDFRKDFTKV